MNKTKQASTNPLGPSIFVQNLKRNGSFEELVYSEYNFNEGSSETIELPDGNSLTISTSGIYSGSMTITLAGGF